MSSSSEKVYRFAVVPKETVNPFYDQVLEGCMEMAGLLSNAECLYVGPESVDAAEQAEIIRGLINEGSVDGISMAVIDESLASELAQEALDANIPLITFDSDAPASKRILYVGTDNFEFGQSLAKVLLQLSPEGGTYGIVDAKPPNIAIRSAGVRYRLLNSRWTESVLSPRDCEDSIALSLQHMKDYAATNTINAIIPVGGWPMRDAVNWKLFVDANRNLTLNVGDTDPNQLDLLAKTYVDGLVGQVPYQMGTESIRLLLELAAGKPQQEVFSTSLVEVIRKPISLPRVNVNQNQYGGLRYIGIIAATIVFASVLAAGLFTFIHRKKRVIKASQPLFLYMICGGVLLMASSLIPLSVDDSWPGHSQQGCNISCMAFPWLLSLGFTTTFAAMFSKTWRVNKIFRTNERYVRQQVSEKDVIVPFVSLLAANVLVLSLWTALSPLEYTRQTHEGTDDWNRVISTYGSCTSSQSLPYTLTLTILNLGLLLVANIQAYRARSIQSEFSESRYIGIIMACMLQTCMVGFPIIFLVGENPQAMYIIMVFMIFATTMAILCLMFIPKVFFVRRYARTQLEAQQSAVRRARSSLPKSQFYDESNEQKKQKRKSQIDGARYTTPQEEAKQQRATLSTERDNKHKEEEEDVMNQQDSSSSSDDEPACDSSFCYSSGGLSKKLEEETEPSSSSQRLDTSFLNEPALEPSNSQRLNTAFLNEPSS